MKLRMYAGRGSHAIKGAELSLENVGINKFRISLPISAATSGAAYSRVATLEASSEKTRSGVTRIMLKCTIPYIPQTTDDNGDWIPDSTKSQKDFSFHCVWSVPSMMANDMLNPSTSAQSAQVIMLAQILCQIFTSQVELNETQDSTGVARIPVQNGPESVDGVSAFPLVPTAFITGSGTVDWPAKLQNVDIDILKNTLVGRVVSGLSPIDVNSDVDLYAAGRYRAYEAQ